jgi:hypothetical protein
MDGGRTFGHDRHIEIGSDHSQAVLFRLGKDARQDRYGRPMLDNTLQDGELLEYEVALQLEFHQSPFQ